MENGNTLSPGQMAHFYAAVLKALPWNIHPVTAEVWAANGVGLEQALRRTLCPPDELGEDRPAKLFHEVLDRLAAQKKLREGTQGLARVLQGAVNHRLRDLGSAHALDCIMRAVVVVLEDDDDTDRADYVLRNLRQGTEILAAQYQRK